MKKKSIVISSILVISISLSSIGIFSKDSIEIKHTNYTTHFSKSKKHPIMVEWWVTSSMVNCSTPLKRKNNFRPDPKLPNETNLHDSYKGSGYDRGHMMPAADNLCQTQLIQDECFYFSNIAPQFHSLNGGDWKSLETFTRALSSENDSVRVWCGNLGNAKKIGDVVVPKQCWKVLYVVKTKQWMCFLFENDTIPPDGYENNRITLKKMEDLTKIKFR